MITDAPNTSVDTVPTHFGKSLQARRESLGLTVKDISAQLRLSESVIHALEANHGPSHLPLIFLRGYLRAYGKLLQIPAEEVAEALELMQPTAPPPPLTIIPRKRGITRIRINSRHAVHLSTYLVVFTLLGLFGMWWHTHTNNPVAIAKGGSPVTIVSETVATEPRAGKVEAAQDASNTSTTSPAPIASHVTPPTATAEAKHAEPSVSAQNKSDDNEDEGDETI